LRALASIEAKYSFLEGPCAAETPMDIIGVVFREKGIDFAVVIDGADLHPVSTSAVPDELRWESLLLRGLFPEFFTAQMFDTIRDAILGVQGHSETKNGRWGPSGSTVAIHRPARFHEAHFTNSVFPGPTFLEFKLRKWEMLMQGRRFRTGEPLVIRSYPSSVVAKSWLEHGRGVVKERDIPAGSVRHFVDCALTYFPGSRVEDVIETNW
jgi:hypothetical protein